MRTCIRLESNKVRIPPDIIASGFGFWIIWLIFLTVLLIPLIFLKNGPIPSLPSGDFLKSFLLTTRLKLRIGLITDSIVGETGVPDLLEIAAVRLDLLELQLLSY